MEPPSRMHRSMMSLLTQFGAVKLTVVFGVEQDQRVQIAIAGVKDVGHAQPVFAR